MTNPTDTNQASEDSMGLDDLLTKFYEDSVDAYHAFMGTYTDTESDETAPDRLIDSARAQIIALIRTEKLKLLAEVRERVVGEDEGLVEVTKRNLVTASHFNAVIKSRNQLRETIRKKLMEAEL